MTEHCVRADIAVIGGGIGGAGIAYFLQPHADVVILEAESQPGYHTTGRSAAFYAETYGGANIQPLSTASKAFFQQPPEGFSETPLLSQRGAAYVFSEDQRALADATLESLAVLPNIAMIDAQELATTAPILKPGLIAGAVIDPDCADMDVAAMLQGYIRGARAQGARLLCDAAVQEMARAGGRWRLKTRAGVVEAETVINAAGAWADGVARFSGARQLGLQPLRRTILTTPPMTPPPDPAMPVIAAVDESYYFKTEGEGFLISPADETPSPAADSQPEIEDVALAIDRFTRVTGIDVRRPAHAWSGLRTFAPDRLPVIGPDPDLGSSFFWCAGQGGWGIQTSPAWSALAAGLVTGQFDPMTESLDPGRYAPTRFARAA